MAKVLLLDFTGVIGNTFPRSDFSPLSKLVLASSLDQSISKLFINQQLFNFLAQPTTIDCYIYSNSAPTKLQLIKELFPDIFTDVISAQETGLYKCDTHSYLEISKLLKVDPQEIIFVDDLIDNIRAAQAAGVQAIHFQSTTQTISQLNNLLIAST